MPGISRSLANINASFASVEYLDGEQQWVRFPTWAGFFLALGHVVGANQKDSERQVVAIVLPTRAYAAAFIATGIVSHSINTHSSVDDDGSHFRRICSLALGTQVKLLDRDARGRIRVLNGLFSGFEDIRAAGGTQRAAIVQVEKSSMEDPRAGGLKRFIFQSQAKSIRLDDEVSESADLPVSQTGRVLVPANRFAQAVLGVDGVGDFNKSSDLTCLLIGSLNVLRAETKEQRFSFEERRGRAEGCLLDLIRIRKFTGSAKAFRSDVFAANSKRPPSNAALAAARTVIFDGSSGFLKWRDYFPTANWIVLLDQGESRFDEGVSAFENCYIRRRAGEDAIPQEVPNPPSGVELVYYSEPF